MDDILSTNEDILNSGYAGTTVLSVKLDPPRVSTPSVDQAIDASQNGTTSKQCEVSPQDTVI